MWRADFPYGVGKCPHGGQGGGHCVQKDEEIYDYHLRLKAIEYLQVTHRCQTACFCHSKCVVGVAFSNVCSWPSALTAADQGGQRPSSAAYLSVPFRALSAQFAANASRESERPFYVMCGFRKPHAPWQAPQRMYDLYDEDTIEIATHKVSLLLHLLLLLAPFRSAARGCAQSPCPKHVEIRCSGCRPTWRRRSSARS
eukprot:COSAG04_NODE_1848_length_5409_cov_7.118644_3_plen_198_part_00